MAYFLQKSFGARVQPCPSAGRKGSIAKCGVDPLEKETNFLGPFTGAYHTAPVSAPAPADPAAKSRFHKIYPLNFQMSANNTVFCCV